MLLIFSNTVHILNIYLTRWYIMLSIEQYLQHSCQSPTTLIHIFATNINFKSTMKKHIRLLTLAAISLAGFTYGNQLQASSPDNAIFSHFTYTGQDKVYNDNKLSANEFYSPILQGCYPDPSICRKGNDYYMHALHLPSIREYLYSILLIW